MSLKSQLRTLLERVTNTLRIIPGATELYLFGSLATPDGDGYSTTDLASGRERASG